MKVFLSSLINSISVLTWLLGISFAVISLPALADSKGASSKSDDSSTDVFILRQLIEIQNELKEMRKEIGALRDEIKQSKPTAAAPRAAATTPSTPVDVQLEEDDPVLGNPEAKVAVVEFTDYQCPYCSKYHTQTFPGLKKEFVDTGKVQYVLRDFPLGFHAKAKGAAIAANCAGKQDKYWEMNDQLFAKQKELSDDLYAQSAQSLGLDMDKFGACLKETTQGDEVTADFTAGQQIGVRGTPTFFVGRIQDGKVVQAKRIVGAQTLPVFAQIIKPLLEEDGK